MPVHQHSGSWASEPALSPVSSSEPKNKRSPDTKRCLVTQGCTQASSASLVQINADSAGVRQAGDQRFCSDRAELIERIKKGESPTWVPSQNLQQEYLKENREPDRFSPGAHKTHPPLLPPLELAGAEGINNVEALRSPIEIDRPRSVLHAGDFKGNVDSRCSEADEQDLKDERLESTPTHGLAPPFSLSTSPHLKQNCVPPSPMAFTNPVARGRAPSLGSFLTSNYVLTLPTTPLVQQSNNTDLDVIGGDRSASPRQNKVRRTLSPHAFRSLGTAPSDCHASVPYCDSSLTHRREASFPFAQQGRRSMTSGWTLQLPPSPPTTAFLRSRRPSFSSEASPQQRASMVGSYEESILRGRMSTAPSKPFDFHAHIGVLGCGKKPKMPPHVTVPFQAVYYDWSPHNGKKAMQDEPSPYVGYIDLHHIGGPESSIRNDALESDTVMLPLDSIPDGTFSGSESYLDDYAAARKKRKRAYSADCPAGSYRIPTKGQIQVVVKNPYKTALKLFLVPYDLDGMRPGQKTFVRQRHYSTGPITERSEPATPGSHGENSDIHKKPALRYLIHLNICCPRKGHFYLYQHIRVVFANRVPDDQEHLRKDIQEPNPKYSPWKSSSDYNSSFIRRPQMPLEIGARRRLSGASYDSPPLVPVRAQPHTSECFSYMKNGIPPVPAIPLHLPRRTDAATKDILARAEDDDASSSELPTGSDAATGSIIEAETERTLSRPSSRDCDKYVKLSKGEAGYGGLGRTGTPEPGEGLLARRLRGLDMQQGMERNEREPSFDM